MSLRRSIFRHSDVSTWRRRTRGGHRTMTRRGRVGLSIIGWPPGNLRTAARTSDRRVPGADANSNPRHQSSHTRCSAWPGPSFGRRRFAFGRMAADVRPVQICADNLHYVNYRTARRIGAYQRQSPCRSTPSRLPEAHRPRTIRSAASTLRISSKLRNPILAPSRPGSTAAACSASTRVFTPPM